MAYQPDEDPFLVEEEASEVGSIAPPPPKAKKNAKALQQANPQPGGNYQYQPQSMYNIPNGGGPPPGQFPGQAPPRGLQSTPSFMVNGPPGPMMRPASTSFYVDPAAPQPYVMLPPPQPYGMPPPAMGYGPPPAVYIQPPPVYPTTASVGYRDRTTLSEQIEELERYQRSRPHTYNNNAADNSLLIATLVSEQDSLYGTNMLENITPMDQEYITSLMQRGVPEHEALRMAFDRKPHALVPPKVTSRVVDTDADKHALEQAIQLSLSESSRRASQPDRPAVTASEDRVDQEALEKAIQLSLSEQQGRQAYRADSDYSAYGSSAYAETSQYAAQYRQQSQHQSHQLSQHHRTGSGGYIAGGTGSYRDDVSVQSGSEYSYHSEDPRGHAGYALAAPETFDRQYPYNLAREAPTEVLRKNYAVSGVDKYRLAQQQQQEYFDHLQAETARSHVAGGSHAGSHGGGSRAAYTTRTEEYTERRGDYDEYEQHRGASRAAEELRAQAYGSHAPMPSTYRESPSSLSPVPDYRQGGGYDRQYPYNTAPEQRVQAPTYGGPQYDEYSGSSRSRSDSGGDEPYDGPVPYTHDQRAQYNRAGGYERSGYDQAEYVQEERREEYRRQEYAAPQQPAYPDAYPAQRGGGAGRMQAPPARQPYGLSPPPAYGNGGDDSDEEGKMDPPPRSQNARGNFAASSSAYSERVETTRGAAPNFQPPSFQRAPSARELRPPQRDDMSETSYGRLTVQSAAPPMMDAGSASRFQTERERFLQQTQQMQMQQMQQQRSAQTTRTSTVTSQQHSSSEYSSSRQPPGYAGNGGLRGPTRGIAAADMDPDEPPPEFALDEDGQPLQKHEWRNTLKRLVNNLTEPSDDEED